MIMLVNFRVCQYTRFLQLYFQLHVCLLSFLVELHSLPHYVLYRFHEEASLIMVPVMLLKSNPLFFLVNDRDIFAYLAIANYA